MVIWLFDSLLRCVGFAVGLTSPFVLCCIVLERWVLVLSVGLALLFGAYIEYIR